MSAPAAMPRRMGLLLRHHLGALRAARGRWLALLTAIALSVAAVVALLQAGERLSASMRANYLGSRPAHAQLLLRPGWDAALADRLLAELRTAEGISAARLGASSSLRLQAPSGATRQATLFALDDGGVAAPRLTAGRAPTLGEVLIERDAAQLLGGATQLTLEDGTRMPISGQVHEPALAPASTEGVVYAFAPRAAMAQLPRTDFVLLRFTQVEAERNQTRADALARRSAAWLQAKGLAVTELRVPPLAEHPHQRQADGAVQMLLACAALSAVLSAITAAALLSGWLEGQRHALGVLKALGAGRGVLLRSLLAGMAALAAAATLAGSLLGLAAGEGLAHASARLLNLQLLPWALSPAALLAALALGLLLPLLFTAGAVWGWAGQPVRVALSERRLSRPGWWDRLPLPGPLVLRLALRNLLRRRRRFALSAALLAVAGAVFMGGLNLRAAWGALVDQGAAQRPYQMELRLPEPAPLALVPDVPDVIDAEPWATRRATWVGEDGIALSRTYPDGGHGQLLLRQSPRQPRLHRAVLAEGRWLADEAQAPELVINTAAIALLGRKVQLGEQLSLVSGAQRLSGQLVGITAEAMSPPTAYMAAPPVTAAATATQWRLRLTPGLGAQDLARVADTLRRAHPGARTVTEADLRRAAAGHVLVLQRALAWVGLGSALVGLVALASALGSSVAERRRELATLRALGASARLLGGGVMLEAAAVVALSLLLALALGAVVDPLLVARLGAISGQPLQGVFSFTALAAWAGVALVCGLLASAWPASSAAKGRRI